MIDMIGRIILHTVLLIISLKISNLWYSGSNIVLICYYTLFSTCVELLFSKASSSCTIKNKDNRGRMLAFITAIAVLLGSGLFLISGANHMLMAPN